ncbi:MAG: hypothetical protein ABJB16_03770 [Saprospiraceae bacterium]
MKSTKNFTMIIACMCILTVFGGGVYEHVVLVPRWSAAPPSSLLMFNGPFGIQGEDFWIPIHPITLFFLGGALIANWYSNRRRKILIVMGGYIVILVMTFGFFVPELITLIGTPYHDHVDPELVRRASTWETLSLIRLSVIAILAFILLSALTKSHDRVKKHAHPAVPLSYENDSMGG